MIRKISWLCLSAFLILQGCKNSQEECAFVPDTGNVKIDLQWESLTDALPAVKTKQELVDFFTRHPLIADEFFSRRAYPNDSAFINAQFDKFTNPHLDTLLMETKRVFGDQQALRQSLTSAFANMKYYYPDFQAPKIQTVITGFERDVFVSDSLIIIGLDYFLGKGAKYEIQGVYDYIKRRYQPDFIVPSITLLYGIDERYNKGNIEDRTMLAEMVSYGKAYHFAKMMNPCTPDSVLIGYTREEMEGSRSYESLIWSRLIEDQVLFSTSVQDKQKYIIERPKTLEVGEKCPGRIGQWIGWRMVDFYSGSHPDKSLRQVMEMTDAGQLFRESGYKPQIVKVPTQKKI